MARARRDRVPDRRRRRPHRHVEGIRRAPSDRLARREKATLRCRSGRGLCADRQGVRRGSPRIGDRDRSARTKRSSSSTPAPDSNMRSSFRAPMRATSMRTSFRMDRRPTAAVAPRRGVLGGAVLLAIGGAFLLPPFGVPNAGAYLFVALGVAFAAAWWVGARQYVYLVPACVLIGFGLGLVIPALLNLPADMAGPVFLGTLAAGLVAVSLLAPARRAPLFLAGILAVVATADLFLQIDLVPLGLQPYFVP